MEKVNNPSLESYSRGSEGILPERPMDREQTALGYPREIESKVDVDDIPAFERILKQSGAIQEYEGARITDYYYGLGEKKANIGGVLSFPVHIDTIQDQDRGKFDQALSYLGLRVKQHLHDRKGDAYLLERPPRIPQRHIRFRTHDGVTSMTVKGKRAEEDKGKIDNRVEIEIPIADPAELEKFFEKIGYKKRHSEIKIRTAYKLGRAVIEINTLPEYGNAVYIEIEAPSQDVINETATRLGIRQDQLLGGLPLGDYLQHLKTKKGQQMVIPGVLEE